MNNLGVGSILAGVIVPSVNGTVSDWPHIALWIAFGLDLIAMAQTWLGRLR